MERCQLYKSNGSKRIECFVFMKRNVCNERGKEVNENTHYLEMIIEKNNYYFIICVGVKI